MKYVAIALLLGNLVYLAWAGFLRPPAKPPPQITGRHDDRLESLTLVRERDQTRQQALNRVINNPIGAESADTDQCTALGPISDIFAAESMVQQAAALDLAAEMRAIDEPTGETEYRVLIPPANSIAEAFRKLRELKSLGVDSYIITQGEQALGISLGLFSTLDAAESLRAARARQGYSAEIDELPQVERQFWVYDPLGEATGPRLDAWRSLAAEMPGAGLETRACPEARDD